MVSVGNCLRHNSDIHKVGAIVQLPILAQAAPNSLTVHTFGPIAIYPPPVAPGKSTPPRPDRVAQSQMSWARTSCPPLPGVAPHLSPPLGGRESMALDGAKPRGPDRR